jgi:hypothetical protein
MVSSDRAEAAAGSGPRFSTLRLPFARRLAEVVVRSWGVLIALVGAMLICGAYHAAVRPLVLTIAGASKLVFIALVLAQGSRYLGQQAAIAIRLTQCGLCCLRSMAPQSGVYPRCIRPALRLESPGTIMPGHGQYCSASPEFRW